jgi:hypothetical protein|tara:strand:- start:69 stop:791 length:723 start_codon:yes stop_codon:yes gene_type:complete
MVNRQDLDVLAAAIKKGTQQAMDQLRDHLITAMNANTAETNAEIGKLSDSLTLLQKETTEVKAKVETLEVRVSEVEEKVLRSETKSSEETQVYEELQMREAKKCNIVVFGLEESEGVPDRSAVTQLLNEIDATADFHLYRAGKSSPTDNKRPIIVKFLSTAQQEKVLHNVSKLRGKEDYKTVSLSPDLTKRQRELNKQQEIKLRDEAEKRNAYLSQEQKNDGIWVPWGRRGARRLIKRTN